MSSSAERAELWVGAAVLLVAAGFLFWSGAGSRMIGTGFGKTYELNAFFPDVGGIEVGTDIRIAGVTVGRVNAVDLDPQTYLAKARLQVPVTVSLPRDSAALIQSDGLLGGAYIELQPGGADDILAPGDEIEDVQGAVSLITLMMKFVDSRSGQEDGQ